MSREKHPHKIPQIEAVNILTGGNAKFTILNVQTQVRFTYKITCPPDKQKDQSTLFFVKVLTGFDNTHMYSYIGILRFSQKTNSWVFDYGNKSKVSNDTLSVRAFTYAFNQIWSTYHTHPNLELWHEGTCCRCGRTLTVPTSIESGIGPECLKIRSLAHRT